MSMVLSVESVRDRVRVSFDDAPSLSICKKHYFLKPLRQGDEVDLEEYMDRLAAVQMADAYESALTMLDCADRTGAEIMRKLRMKGYIDRAAEAVVARLAENRLIDDKSYAKRFAEGNMRRPIGKYALQQKLRAKGISPDDAESALESFDDAQQLEAAKSVAQKLYRKYEALPPREARMKLAQALARRGFAWETVKAAVSAAIRPSDP